MTPCSQLDGSNKPSRMVSACSPSVKQQLTFFSIAVLERRQGQGREGARHKRKLDAEKREAGSEKVPLAAPRQACHC